MNAIFTKFSEALSNPFIIIGFLGQMLFFGRFIVQWIASERKGESHIPHLFWYFSIGGGILILIYSISIGDIVFTLGSGLNLIIYFRNITLIRKNKLKFSEEN